MRTLRHAWLAAAIVAALPATAALANDQPSTSDPGFVPDTGQINLGYDPKVPSSSMPLAIPTPAQTLAAFETPESAVPALGTFGNSPPTPQTATTGVASAAAAAAPSGPIGAIGVTEPAKFSQSNDVLDRTPIMALPLPLTGEQRKSIYQAVMADKTPAANGADELAPASELSSAQYFNDLHPLPASVKDIGVVKSLAYVKATEQGAAGRTGNTHRSRPDHFVIGGSRHRRGAMAFCCALVRLSLRGKLVGPLRHCVRLSAITFIEVVAAWLRLA